MSVYPRSEGIGLATNRRQANNKAEPALDQLSGCAYRVVVDWHAT